MFSKIFISLVAAFGLAMLIAIFIPTSIHTGVMWNQYFIPYAVMVMGIALLGFLYWVKT